MGGRPIVTGQALNAQHDDVTRLFAHIRWTIAPGNANCAGGEKISAANARDIAVIVDACQDGAVMYAPGTG